MYFNITNEVITKVGQYPSIADLHLPEIRKYRKILGDEKYKDFSRGISLSAHDIGIGSFVYLRRVFEGLIDEAYQEASSEDENWDDKLFANSKMDAKILILKDYLPVFLVENRGLYGILSKGVHSLSEQECLQYFSPVRVAIELILDEKMEREKKRSKIEMAKKAISDIKNKLR